MVPKRPEFALVTLVSESIDGDRSFVCIYTITSGFCANYFFCAKRESVSRGTGIVRQLVSVSITRDA